MLTGKCLCGGVRYEIGEELGPVICCHCSMCRRASGSAFATNASVRSTAYRVVAGKELINEYESSPGSRRGFCSRCGTPLYNRFGYAPALHRVRLGTLDSDPGRRPIAHIWTGSKAPWFEISDDLQQFEEMPPRALLRPHN